MGLWARIKQVPLHILLMWDQVLNSLWLGHLDETVSSRLGRSIGKERYFWVLWLRKFVDFIFLWHAPNHCENNVLGYWYGRDWSEYVDEIWSWNNKPGQKVNIVEKVFATTLFVIISAIIIYVVIKITKCFL
jgi:hypothetical protein